MDSCVQFWFMFRYTPPQLVVYQVYFWFTKNNMYGTAVYRITLTYCTTSYIERFFKMITSTVLYVIFNFSYFSVQPSHWDKYLILLFNVDFLLHFLVSIYELNYCCLIGQTISCLSFYLHFLVVYFFSLMSDYLIYWLND